MSRISWRSPPGGLCLAILAVVLAAGLQAQPPTPSPRPTTAPAGLLATRPATRPTTLPATRPRHYTSIAEILRDLPADARPNPARGWAAPDKFTDEFQFKNATKWLHGLRGATFSARLPVDRIILRSSGADAWNLQLTVSSDDAKLPGVIFGTIISAPRMGYFYLEGDEKFARRADRLKQGQFVGLEGTIDDVELTPSNTTHSQLRLVLRDYTVKLPE